MTAAATTTQEASLAARAVAGSRNVGAMRTKRPCEVSFLLLLFFGQAKKSRFKHKESLSNKIVQ